MIFHFWESDLILISVSLCLHIYLLFFIFFTFACNHCFKDQFYISKMYVNINIACASSISLTLHHFALLLSFDSTVISFYLPSVFANIFISSINSLPLLVIVATSSIQPITWRVLLHIPLIDSDNFLKFHVK